jgi:uncharacterized protein (DUF2147 family)
MKLIVMLTVICLLFPAIPIEAQKNNIIGSWWNEEGTSQIRIFKATNGKYYGKIDYLKHEPGRKDVNNPDKEMQTKPLLGLMILEGFTYSAEQKQWTGGTIYDPKNGKTYDCYMWFGDEPDMLHIKGYVLGMKFVGRETHWKKVN